MSCEAFLKLSIDLISEVSSRWFYLLDLSTLQEIFYKSVILFVCFMIVGMLDELSVLSKNSSSLRAFLFLLNVLMGGSRF